jgi:hypothetical protein
MHKKETESEAVKQRSSKKKEVELLNNVNVILKKSDQARVSS